MTDSEQRAAATAFVEEWCNRGDEKQDTQAFWMSLLQNVFGVETPSQYIEFEKKVKLDHVSFIDGYIPKTRVLIEQKGAKIDLLKGIKQSDGSVLTPFQQARRYSGYMDYDERPRWIVVSNFTEFHIHDMNRPNGEPEIVRLEDLPKECYRLQFLVDEGNPHLKREMQVSIDAGKVVGKLYDAFIKQYANPDSAESMRSLNVLCVRLVFCLYAEDAGIFGRHGMFHDYLADYDTRQMRQALARLFRILNTPVEARDPYLADDDPTLAAFPYVNGGLFAEEHVEIPPFTDEIRSLILKDASDDFDWSEISPTIFGAVFESTLNPETRRAGGMHYTSIENIHKVIDPLFLDELTEELATINTEAVVKTKERKLRAYQDKLAGLTFLDPACGSGNFLTETYLSLRRLENDCLTALYRDQISMGFENLNPIKVSIEQFYGIEINDFAVTVAKTALWIAESQMLKETEAIVRMTLDFLPLTTNASIVEGNALRIDWEDVVPKDKLSYIMGNPPFVGYTYQSSSQKDDLRIISALSNLIGKNLDYVAGWYFKAAQMMQNTMIRTAFVSTNSVCQGEQVVAVWKPITETFNAHIDFAHRTFRWDSEANEKAHVHCVIVGFSHYKNAKNKYIYDNGRLETAENINAYLINAPDIYIEKRKFSLYSMPEMVKGSQPTDDGNFFLTTEEKREVLLKEPELEKFIHRVYGSAEFINNRERFCFWLADASPSEIRKSKILTLRIENIRKFRAASTKAGTRKYADMPTLFQENRQPTSDYILIPSTSSERRRYIPVGFVESDIVSTNANLIIPEATYYHFGILTSNIHMAWMRTVCGRLKSDYRYSNTIVYNNFPWPEPTDAQRAIIEKTAQAILDARALYPDSSLADLYDELTMPPELRKAHQNNDRAVMAAYGITKDSPEFTSESACVAMLMRLYQEKVNELEAASKKSKK